MKNCQNSDWTMLISTLNSIKDKSAIIAHISGTGHTSEEYSALN
jgi:glucose-6-phosphate isomerase